MLDISLLGMAISAAITPLAKPDYMVWTITVFGALLGGLIGARMFRAEGESLYSQWAVSTGSGIVFAPLIFDLLTQPGYVVTAAAIPATPNALMGVSATVAVFSWGALRFAERAWKRIAANWLDANHPPRRRRSDKGGDP
jgi:hypothetical protein